MEKELTDAEFEYYSRQIALDEIGYAGQVQLKNSKACILGCGGLGVPTMLKLTSMGVGHLRIVDRDIVSMSDLHRQYLYDVESIGKPKVEVASEKLRRLNPNIEVEPLAESIIKRNIEEIVDGMNVVLDGLDSMETRYLINRACLSLNVPYIFAGVIRTIANASTIIPGKTPCLECLFPGFEDSSLPKCSLVGVHPAAIGVISSVQVSEAVRILTGRAPKLAGKILLFDLEDLSFDKIDVTKHERCKICGSQQISFGDLPERYFEEECARDGRRTFVLTPKIRVSIEIGRLLDRLNEEGIRVKHQGNLGVSFIPSDFLTASLLKSGTMIVQAAPMKGSGPPEDEIIGLYRRVMVEWLGLPVEIVPSKPSL
ncbi:HesA/MoeB/ThiF family protein [Candidatus Bathyarchaeota archaeon]|nr:HesA/MoeB/ThiF family protein [Candidatus Bathyarchaeota archaeon]